MRVQRYKALHDIQIDVPDDLLLLIGQNGAGKSSILQALSFVRYFAEGRAGDFFEDRNWLPLDVRHRSSTPQPTTLTFHLAIQDNHNRRFVWRFDWGLKTARNLTEELWSVDAGEVTLLAKYSRTGGLRIEGEPSLLNLRLGGSVFAAVEPEAFGDYAPIVEGIQAWAEGITSLELLSPKAIRGSNRRLSNDIGTRGERLAGFLAGLESSRRGAIVERLARYYPISDIDTVRKRAGWIDMRIADAQSGLKIQSEHVSDGLLRMLAICALPELGEAASLILLDEIEDGIDPHILPRLVSDMRAETSAQLVITSHSPILVNYVEPSHAVIVNRDRNGRTYVAKASDLRTFIAGDDVFGAGELWLNTSLPTLATQALHVQREPRTGSVLQKILQFAE